MIKNRLPARQSGMTLVEVLLGMAIFAIVSGVFISSVQYSTRMLSRTASYERLDDQMDRILITGDSSLAETNVNYNAHPATVGMTVTVTVTSDSSLDEVRQYSASGYQISVENVDDGAATLSRARFDFTGELEYE